MYLTLERIKKIVEDHGMKAEYGASCLYVSVPYTNNGKINYEVEVIGEGLTLKELREFLGY